jgi:hypothetical protein
VQQTGAIYKPRMGAFLRTVEKQLSPGTRVTLTQGLDLTGYVQLPVYQNVNSVQITADRNLFLGLN